MLYLNPPYYYIDGVSLLPDHADKLQWYFMPLYPRFSTNPNTGDVQLSFLKYRGLAGTGGFLSFDVNVGIDQAALDGVAAKLQDAAGLDGTPHLLPVPLVDGSVRLILFDQQSAASPGAGAGGAGAGGAAGGTGGSSGTGVGNATAGSGSTGSGDPAIRFVEQTLQATKPSLYGDNQAIFSVQLSQYGVTVLDQALQGTMTPIGIIYDLEYVGLRPAFQVKLTVDWDRVYHYVDQMEGVDGIFVSADVEHAFSSLKDSRAIVMEADLFVPEGEDASTVVSDFTRAENEVRDMFTDAFFKPSIEPTKESKDGWDKATDFAKGVGRYAATGGISTFFTYQKKEYDLTQIDHKWLNANLQERTAVQRTIHPQGHLSGIAQVLAGDPSKYISSVDLDNPFFQRRTLTPSALVAGFASDQIASIHVEASYGGTPQDVVLDTGHASVEMTWSSVVTDGQFQWPVNYDYEVAFQTVDTSQRPQTITTKGHPGWPRTTVNTTEVITPRSDLYTIVDVPIYTVDFPFAEWPHVEVDLSYIDEANGINQQAHFIFEASNGNSMSHWSMFVLDRTKTTFTYQTTFVAADNTVTIMPQVTTDEALVRIFDPFPNKRTLQIFPALDWIKVDRAFVDVTYEDPQNNINQSQSYEFNSKRTDTQTFTVDLHDPNRRQIQYSVTIVFKDGHTVTIPTSYTLLPRVSIQTDLRGHRVVDVHTSDASFAAVGLTKADVDIRYNDTQAGISAEDVFTLTSPSETAYFEFDYVDASHSKYEYQTTYHYDNGMSKTTDWQTSDLNDLSVPVS